MAAKVDGLYWNLVQGIWHGFTHFLCGICKSIATFSERRNFQLPDAMT
jgi:hypothetical protein